MCHMWSLTDVRLSCWEISAADIHPLMSCLLAKTRSAALRSSWNHIIPTETFKYFKKWTVVNMPYMWLFVWKGGSEVWRRLRLQTREVHNACLSRLCNPPEITILYHWNLQILKKMDYCKHAVYVAVCVKGWVRSMMEIMFTNKSTQCMFEQIVQPIALWNYTHIVLPL